MLDAAKSDFGNKAAEIRFIKFLIGRDESDIDDKLTELRERGSPSEKRSKTVKPRSPKTKREDLLCVKPFFSELKLIDIVNSINEEIEGIDELS